MEFRILGQVQALDGGRALPLGGQRQRALLALLLLHANEPLSADRLIDELWGEDAPASAARRLQVSVHRLRRALDGGERDGLAGDLLVTHSAGYLLRVEHDALDSERFEALVQEGREALADGDAERAAETLRGALALWRGPALADVSYESFALLEIARLEELRLAALEARIDADLELGAAAELVPELEALLARHPLRERLCAQLMLALYRAGRQAEALEAYRRTRLKLHEELGLEPGAELRRLEQEILRQDPQIGGAARTSRDGGGLRVSRSPRKRWRLRAALAAAVVGIAALAVVLSGARSSHAAPVRANSVAVIDPGTNRLAGSVAVGARPGPITVGENAVWVGNLDDASVSRIDPRSAGVVRTIAVGDAPAGVAAGEGGVWVASSNNAVREIDPSFDAVNEIRRASRGYLYAAALPSPVVTGLGSVWVASRTTVDRLNPRRGLVTATTGVGLSPAAIAVGFGSVWVTDSAENTVTRIDPATGLTTTLQVGHAPDGIATGAGAVWVSDAADSAVVRIDPATTSVTTTIHVAETPAGVAVGGGGVWVADSGSGTVSRIDSHTNKVVATVALGNSPTGVVVAAGRVWVSVQAAGASPTTTNPLPGGAGEAAHVDLQSDSDLRSLDPALADSPDAWQIEYATCATLLGYPDRPAPAGQQLAPEAAATMPRISRGGRAYTFTVRNGLRFSPPSGAPVTAQTFRSTILRTLSHGMQSPADAFMSDVVGARAYMAGRASGIAGLSVAGDTLTIRLNSPAPDLPARIASPYFCAVPADTPRDPGGVRGIPAAGPYYVAAYTPGRRIVVAHNPNYRGPRSHRIGEFVYTIGIDPAHSVPRVESGSADYFITSALGGQISHATDTMLTRRYGGAGSARGGRPRYFVNPTPTSNEIWLNTSRPLFANVRLRRAFNYAISRAALIRDEEASGGPRFLPADQYLPPGVPGYRPIVVYPLGEPDLAKARRIAGRGPHGTAVLYGGLYSAADDQIIVGALNAIGIQVVVKHFPINELFARERRRHEPFDVVNGGNQPDYPDPFDILNLGLDGRYIGGPNASNISHFDDPAYNRGLRAAARLTGAARYAAYAALDAQLTRAAAPMVAWAVGTSQDFFSARIGCQTYQPVYGMDLAALCVR